MDTQIAEVESQVEPQVSSEETLETQVEESISQEEVHETSSEPTVHKKSKTKAPTKPVMPTFKQDVREIYRAQQKAVAEHAAIATGYEYQVPLSNIVGTDNPRAVPRTLSQMGYKLVDVDDPDHSLLHLGISEDLDQVRQCVALFDEHENDPDENEDEDFVEASARSIVTLAEQFRKVGLLQAIVVRPVGKTEKRSLIFGQRRLAAMIYLHAKSRLEIEDGVEDAKLIPATIRAVERKVTAEEAYHMAVSENIHRENFNPLEEGLVYKKYLEEINPVTKKKHTLKQVAQMMGVNIGRVRSYAALQNPRNEKTQKGLTDQDREDLAAGKITVTAAIRKSLNEQHYNDGRRQTNRARSLPLKEMQKLFDLSGENRQERRQAIADCMGIELEIAILESEIRIAEAEAKEAKKARKKGNQEEPNEFEPMEEDLIDEE